MYKYEMHCHTSEVSKCSRVSGAELADCYKNFGYDGVVITDHFFNGNTTVPRDLPWNERVEMFTAGFEAARKRGNEIGLDVLFAWEWSYHGTDILTYGLDKDWLMKNEGCDLLTINDYCDLVRTSGGYAVHAHPMREADYIDWIRLFPRKIDAVETYNACRTELENRLANEYADNYELPKMCGSDNHAGYQKNLAALLLDFKPKNTGEIMRAVSENRHKIEKYEVLL